MSASTRRAGQPVRPRPGDLPAARDPRRRADLPRDQLLHRHHHRAPPRPRRRAARGLRLVRADGLRERPVDVLQAATRPTWSSSSASTSTRSSRTGRSRTRSPSCWPLRRTMTIELDAWYLPDTAATSYRTEHVKTRVIAEAIDLDDGRLPLLPQRSLYELDGADFRGVFRHRQRRTRRPAAVHRADPVRRRAAPRGRMRSGRPRATGSATTSTASCRATRSSGSGRGSRRPAVAPRGRRRRLPRLRVRDVPDGRRRVRAAARPTSTGCSASAGAPASAAMAEIVEGCKVLGFKLARRRPFDPSGRHRVHGGRLDRAIGALDEVVR